MKYIICIFLVITGLSAADDIPVLYESGFQMNGSPKFFVEAKECSSVYTLPQNWELDIEESEIDLKVSNEINGNSIETTEYYNINLRFVPNSNIKEIRAEYTNYVQEYLLENYSSAQNRVNQKLTSKNDSFWTKCNKSIPIIFYPKAIEIDFYHDALREDSHLYYSPLNGGSITLNLKINKADYYSEFFDDIDHLLNFKGIGIEYLERYLHSRLSIKANYEAMAEFKKRIWTTKTCYWKRKCKKYLFVTHCRKKHYCNTNHHSETFLNNTSSSTNVELKTLIPSDITTTERMELYDELYAEFMQQNFYTQVNNQTSEMLTYKIKPETREIKHYYSGGFQIEKYRKNLSIHYPIFSGLEDLKSEIFHY